MAGFNRLSPAGDGRHVLVSTRGRLPRPRCGRVDGGARRPRALLRRRAAAHGPGLHANKAGHVVNHADTTVLFSDGSGKAEIFDPAALADALAAGLPPRAPTPLRKPTMAWPSGWRTGSCWSRWATRRAAPAWRCWVSGGWGRAGPRELLRNEELPRRPWRGGGWERHGGGGLRGRHAGLPRRRLHQGGKSGRLRPDGQPGRQLRPPR